MTTAQTHAMAEIFGEVLLSDPDNSAVKEAFDRVRQLLGREDAGWEVFKGGDGKFDAQYGLTLSDLKSWGKKIRPAVVGAPWVGAGFRRRCHYVWQNGIRYGNIPKGGTQGVKNVQQIIDRPGNQFHFFSKTARRAREESLYSEGVAFWIGNEKTKDLEAIPLWQITDELLHPQGLGFALAYLREWHEYNIATGESEPKKAWYFTDQWVGKRVTKIKTKGDPEPVPVDQKHVIFDMHANRSTGLVYGAPDALAAYVWNEIARDATMDGRSVQQALASFSFKAVGSSRDQAENMAIKLASTDGAGNIAVGGAGTDLVPLANAGKGYDFSTIRFLVAIVAASLDISVIDLTSNPGDAGASYGSAQTLDLPTRLAMEARRADHIELDTRVLKWMGVSEPEVNFVPYASGEEIYRASQALVLEYAADVYSRQELRDHLDDLHARPNGTVPEESESPSIVKAKLLATIEAEHAAKAAKAAADADMAKQAAAPAQGQSNGTGGQQGGNASNDIRRD